ncbi:MAG TPA: HAD-IB family hydrolase, partial [Thermoleophilia bacterium]|nr:HAD-IB family hydrolase [Thermoleophilia bacterium]
SIEVEESYRPRSAGQTQKMLVAFMRARGLVPGWFLAGTALWFLGYKLGLVEPNDQARKRGAVLFAGRTVEEVRDLMADFFEEKLAPRLFPPVLAELGRHLGADRRVVLLSAAFAPLVEVSARRLGVREFVATDLEVAAGRFTGRVLGSPVYGGEKAAVAANLLGEAGRTELCYAYADHDTDLELLRLVGQPVAVRPRPGLRRVAMDKGWRILE